MPTDVTFELRLTLDESQSPEAMRKLAAKKLGVPLEDLPELHVLRRAIDARGKGVHIQVLFGLGPQAPAEEWALPHPREVSLPSRVVIVGSGPAGLFCAYELARHGIASRIIDRGKRVQPRRRDIALLNREGKVDPDSNYCFGEGGAGTYSDGKLYTRAHKRGSVRDVLEILALHGAPAAILEDARPHIGSNKLPKVVTALRERLESVGVEIHFEAKLERLLVEGQGGNRRVSGVELADGRTFEADAVVLATGHSARDVYEMLDAMDVTLEPKAFAMGVRVEHPQALINKIQYGRDAGHAALPSAYYRLATSVEDRGVFTFCMCPGGWIVPATTEAGAQVVNGMSLSKRDSPFANSGIVAGIEPADWQAQGFDGPLGGIRFQRELERAAYEAGGGNLRAPATMMKDFLAGRGSSTVPKSSYKPGLTATRLDEVLDFSGVRISEMLRGGLTQFARRMPGFLSHAGVLLGVESRTSSPVRIPRRDDTLESPDVRGLYPSGEGAGYAGGIVSAALDGKRVAEALQQQLAPRLPLT
ncbi:MAG TPA: FAD-dependent oxidoreductase [Polyangiales bacterium]|nr:FAD-dependent oxidoreductase [Polyangiales bacterium]